MAEREPLLDRVLLSCYRDSISYINEGVFPMTDLMNHEHDMTEEEIPTISLTDAEGNETEFVFLDDVEYDGKEYVVLVPLTEDDEAADDEVVILEVISRENTDEIEAYCDVESEEVLHAVFRVFEANNPDLFEEE